MWKHYTNCRAVLCLSSEIIPHFKNLSRPKGAVSTGLPVPDFWLKREPSKSCHALEISCANKDMQGDETQVPSRSSASSFYFLTTQKPCRREARQSLKTQKCNGNHLLPSCGWLGILSCQFPRLEILKREETYVCPKTLFMSAKDMEKQCLHLLPLIPQLSAISLAQVWCLAVLRESLSYILRLVGTHRWKARNLTRHCVDQFLMV